MLDCERRDEHMPADKRTNSTHVRLSDEADAVLELMSKAQQREKATVLAELAEEALLGRGHAIRMAALRFARLGLSGRCGE
jgi:hypothetical protein